MKQPNVLFLAIDDQNDWIGCLAGHPLASTPNIDRLAAGGTLFTNAHCQAPLCNPSRTSVMLGLRPSTTGIYGLEPWFRTTDEFRHATTLAQHFRNHGYHTSVGGKIFHPGNRPENDVLEFDQWGPPSSIGIRPDRKLIPATPMGNHPLMDWGVFPHVDEEKGDYQLASWVISQLENQPKDRPFFLAAGFFLPHVPCYVTDTCYDSIPDSDQLLPKVLELDREDTPRFSWYLHWKLPEPRWKWLQEHGQWRNLVRSYLASTRFVDEQIGRVMQSLDRSGLREDTIVVLWSDHGWHLGEKGITGKNSLWERSTRVPLIWSGPGIGIGQSCPAPVELLDLFPTLNDLCHLPQPAELEGLSLVPQMKDPSTPRPRPAITTHNQGNHAVRSLRHRYIRYADGTEEFYDLIDDPHEWTNLVQSPEWQTSIEEHRTWLPKIDRPPISGSAHRVLTYDRVTGRVNWEGNDVRASDPIPD